MLFFPELPTDTSPTAPPPRLYLNHIFPSLPSLHNRPVFSHTLTDFVSFPVIFKSACQSGPSVTPITSAPLSQPGVVCPSNLWPPTGRLVQANLVLLNGETSTNSIECQVVTTSLCHHWTSGEAGRMRLLLHQRRCGLWHGLYGPYYLTPFTSLHSVVISHPAIENLQKCIQQTVNYNMNEL